LSSGIPNFLLAPINGDNTHRRLQTLIAGQLKDRQPKPPPTNKMQVVKQSTVPTDMLWQKMNSDNSDYGGILWQGIKPTGNANGKTVYFNGNVPPKYNSTTKEWDTGSNGKFLEIDNKSEIPKTESPLDKSFDWIKALEETRTDIVSSNQKGDSVTTALALDHSDSHPLAQSIKEALRKHPRLVYPPLEELAELSRMTVCPVKTIKYCGYLICVNSSNLFLKDFLLALVGTLSKELEVIGDAIIHATDILEVETFYVPFLPWANSKSDFSLVSDKNGLAFAFFSTDELPQIIDGNEENLLGIQVGHDIAPDAMVTFDMYIHLPQNKKYLLYLNQGQTFTSAMKTKFTSYGISIVYIRKEDRERFLTYCSKNFIEASILSLKIKAS
jgi:hypothetical protein